RRGARTRLNRLLVVFTSMPAPWAQGAGNGHTTCPGGASAQAPGQYSISDPHAGGTCPRPARGAGGSAHSGGGAGAVVGRFSECGQGVLPAAQIAGPVRAAAPAAAPPL